MRFLFLMLFGLLSIRSNAGGFLFPNVEYSYAKLYFFNIDLDSPSEMEMQIYKDGAFAMTKLGNGILLSEEFHEAVQRTLARGMDELYYGLAKCYFPRHGVIYYDENNKPVASMSICFECDRVMVWSSREITFSDEKRDFKKAEKQMEKLLKIVQSEGIIAGQEESFQTEYSDYIAKKYPVPNKMEGITQLELNYSSEKFIPEFSEGQLEELIDSKYAKRYLREKTAEEDSIQHYHLDKGTDFYFDETGLTKAKVTESSVILPHFLRVGVSTGELHHFFPDIPTSNNLSFSSILITYSDYTVTLELDRVTVKRVLLQRRE